MSSSIAQIRCVSTSTDTMVPGKPHLPQCCQDQGTDFRRQKGVHTPITINGDSLPTVESLRILRTFYNCTIESILTGCFIAWFGNCTTLNCKALQRVVRSSEYIIGTKLPSLQDIFTDRCLGKARKIIKDSSHPSHILFSMLPSRKWYRNIKARTSRLRDSFFSQIYYSGY